MSEANTDDFDLISVEIIREESAVITVKVPKGHSGPPPDIFQDTTLPDIFQDTTLGDQIFGALEPLHWICENLRVGAFWNTHRPSAHVFDARPLIQKGGGIIPKTVSGSSEGEE
jgi:hypothetical protein